MVQLYQFPIGQRVEVHYGCQILSRHPRNGGLITLLEVGGCIRPHGLPIVALGMGLVSQSFAA